MDLVGWTTDAESYIKIYTPTETNEVGVSQRHDGTDGTGYVLSADTSPAEVLRVYEDYTKVHGLEITASAGSPKGIQTAGNGLELKDLVIHDLAEREF